MPRHSLTKFLLRGTMALLMFGHCVAMAAEPAVSIAPVTSSTRAASDLDEPKTDSLTELANANSTTVRNEDGSYTATISSGLVNYLDESGNWRPISNTLVAAPGPAYAVQNEANDFTISIPENPAVTPLKFEYDGDRVSMKLIGSDDVTPSVVDSSATFQDLVPAADRVTYEATDTGVKETITLDEAPKVPVSYTYRLQVGGSVIPTLTERGSVEFRDGSDEVRFVIPRGNMVDSAVGPSDESGVFSTGSFSDEVEYTLAAVGSGWLLTITPSFAWLSNPERVYPVNIDPTVDKIVQKDCWLEQESPNKNHCGDSFMSVAGSGTAGYRHRALFDFNLNGIPSGSTINSATALMWQDVYSTGGAASEGSFALFNPTASWGACASWNATCKTEDGNPPNWIGGGMGGQISANVAVTNGAWSGFIGWDVTGRVAGWITGEYPNRGVLLRQVGGENVNKALGFVSSTHPETTLRPRLRVDFNWDGDWGAPNSAEDDLGNISTTQYPSNVNGRVLARSDGTCPFSPPGYPCVATYDMSAGPFPACGNFDDRFKVVNFYYRPNFDANSVSAGRYMVGSRASMRCGLYVGQDNMSRFGYRHVQDRHAGDWGRKSAYIYRQWLDLADWAIAWTLADPDAITIVNPDRYCYQRVVALADEDGVIIDRFRTVIWMGETSQRLMSTYPTSAGGSGYCLGSTRGAFVLRNVGPRV